MVAAYLFLEFCESVSCSYSIARGIFITRYTANNSNFSRSKKRILYCMYDFIIDFYNNFIISIFLYKYRICSCCIYSSTSCPSDFSVVSTTISGTNLKRIIANIKQII